MLPLRSYQHTFLYTLLHFVVDGICASLVFSKLYDGEYRTCLIVFLVYNFLAFLSQPFVGILMDKYYKPKIFLCVSVLMLVLGYAFSFQFIVSSICLGIGNSIFHVCGGKDVTMKTKNNIISIGVFVSTGAFGLMLGQRCYSDALLISFYSILFIGAVLLNLSKEEAIEKEEFFHEKKKLSKGVIFLVLILFVVAVRSFVGKIVVIEFETSLGVFIGIAAATTLGKALGGVVTKYLGCKKTIFVSMVIAIVCLCLGNSNPYTLCLGILMFNFSMPITLYYANHISNGKEGFAFGALAAALIPGYLFGMLEYSILSAKLCTVILSVLSASIICLLDRGVKEYGTL